MKLKCSSDLRWNSHCGHGRKTILYHIPQEFQIKYPSELVFKYRNLVSSLSDSEISNIPKANHLLMIGYKIKDWNYDYFDAREIMRAREIFKNDTYQIIEPKKWRFL